jgi:hypothetical protein
MLHDVMGSLHQYVANVVASVDIGTFRNASVAPGEFHGILP